MNVAIVGSREFRDERLVRQYVRCLPQGTVVVSGGARGVDSWAIDEARKNGYVVHLISANWSKLGKRAGFARNAEIVKLADKIVAFWDNKSRGTAHTIKLAYDAKKPLEVFA